MLSYVEYEKKFYNLWARGLNFDLSFPSSPICFIHMSRNLSRVILARAGLSEPPLVDGHGISTKILCTGSIRM